MLDQTNSPRIPRLFARANAGSSHYATTYECAAKRMSMFSCANHLITVSQKSRGHLTGTLKLSWAL